MLYEVITWLPCIRPALQSGQHAGLHNCSCERVWASRDYLPYIPTWPSSRVWAPGQAVNKVKIQAIVITSYSIHYTKLYECDVNLLCGLALFYGGFWLLHDTMSVNNRLDQELLHGCHPRREDIQDFSRFWPEIRVFRRFSYNFV